MRKYFTFYNILWMLMIAAIPVYILIFGFNPPKSIDEFFNRFVMYMGYFYIGTWVARLVMIPIFFVIYWYKRRQIMKNSPFAYLLKVQELVDKYPPTTPEYPNGYGWRHRQNKVEQPED